MSPAKPEDLLPAMPSTVLLDLIDTVHRFEAQQSRLEGKMDILLRQEEHAIKQRSDMLATIASNREEMYKRFEELRKRLEQLDRRVDPIERDLSKLAPEIKILSDVRLQTAGALWLMRIIWIVLGALGTGVITLGIQVWHASGH